MSIRSLSLVLLAASGLVAGSAAANNSRWNDTNNSRWNDWSAGPSITPWSVSYPIEGLWNVSVEITDCANGSVLMSFDAMGLFARGGAFHDASASNLRSPGFGQWRHLKGRRYEFAFRLFRFDAAGTYLGSQIVRHTVTLDRGGDSYESEGTAEFFDPDGQPASVPPPGCSRSTATRFE